MKILGFEQCLADACIFRLVKWKNITISAVIHVCVLFAVGMKRGLSFSAIFFNKLVFVNNLGKLTGSAGYH